MPVKPQDNHYIEPHVDDYIPWYKKGAKKSAPAPLKAENDPAENEVSEEEKQEPQNTTKKGEQKAPNKD